MKFPHSVRYGGASLLIALSLLLLLPVRAQRPAPKSAPTANATTPPPAADEKSPPVTFDTLLAADTYGIYAEMRAVGRHANSQEIAQLLAPFTFEGSDAPDELLSLYGFIKSHADALMTSRLMFASMPVRGGVPDTLLALEMPSVEEARKFVPELKQFVAAHIAPQPEAAPVLTATSATPATSNAATSNAARRRGRARVRAATAAAENAPDAARAKRPAAPQFQIKRAGSLIAMSGASFTFKDLHRADQALLVNEPGFQAARSRFSTDTLFVYFNTVRMNSSTKHQLEAREKEWRRMEEEAAKERSRRRGKPGRADDDIIVEDETAQLSGGNGNMNVRPDGNGNFSVTMNGNMNTANTNAAVSPEFAPPSPEASPEPTPAPLSEKELEEERQREQSRRFTETLGSFVFGGRGGNNESWPESIGVGASLEGDALVVRGLFVSQSEDQPLRPIPFLPVLLSGPSIAAEAAAVLPASTDIFLSVSLDLPQMYDYVASLMKIADFLPTPEENEKGKFAEQLTAFEKTNNFRIREDLLAALGNEIAVGLPGNQFFGGRSMTRIIGDADAAPPSGPIIVVALNDREGLQKLLPRVLSAIGFAGATEQSIIEKHGQVEVLTFSNGTLAFIDRFLVGAPDAATMRRVVDAYNNGETLANNEHFRDATSWQSRQAVGQVYVANEMLKSMFAHLTKSVEDIEDPALRAHVMQLDPDPGSITHLATRESNGLMHELRLPKNLISLFTAGQLVDQKLLTIRNNESMAQFKLQMIHNTQSTYKEKTGRYATLEELIAAGNSDEGFRLSISLATNDPRAPMELDGYDIKLSASGDKFEATATPTGYPKLGRRSFYIDQTGSLRGSDTGGKPATEASPIIE
ncbi:MAG TPA: DUF3352 domain-containing protein [Pyrinomonadaceae bacterium]|jgi:hypothetical protein|nr:DUF3352 domain-containing protein [Pyrinomonadaceae bacterium]